MPAVDFVDISMWQGDVDWDALPVPAVVKASEGVHADPRWAGNAAEGRRTGKLMGAYHFLDHAIGGRMQAQAFLQIVAPLLGELLVFDWETDSHGVVPDLEIVEAFVAEVRSQGHGDMLRLYGNEWHAAHALNLGVPFWCAWYGADVEQKVRDRDAVAWQWASDGQVPGIAGRVDVNQILDRDRWMGEQMPSAAEIAEAVWSHMLTRQAAPELGVERHEAQAADWLLYNHAELVRPDKLQARLVAALTTAAEPAAVDLNGDEIARLAAALIAQIPK